VPKGRSLNCARRHVTAPSRVLPASQPLRAGGRSGGGRCMLLPPVLGLAWLGLAWLGLAWQETQKRRGQPQRYSSPVVVVWPSTCRVGREMKACQTACCSCYGIDLKHTCWEGVGASMQPQHAPNSKQGILSQVGPASTACRSCQSGVTQHSMAQHASSPPGCPPHPAAPAGR